MGMMVGITNSSIKTIVFKNPDGTTAGSMSMSRQGKTKKKRINYSFKQISARIMNAKTSSNSRSVTAMARSKTAMLRQKLMDSEYDSKELESALAHAIKMEEISVRKTKHLQQEERIERKECRNGGGIDKIEQGTGLNVDDSEVINKVINEDKDVTRKIEELENLMKEYEKLIEEAGQMQESSSRLDEIMEIIPEDMSRDDLTLLKKKHRAVEMKKIMEADLQYLKAMFDRLAKEKQDNGNNISSSGETGVSLELTGMEIPVQLTEAAALPEGSLDIMV